jgi:hypothetical protein
MLLRASLKRPPGAHLVGADAMARGYGRGLRGAAEGWSTSHPPSHQPRPLPYFGDIARVNVAFGGGRQ